MPPSTLVRFALAGVVALACSRAAVAAPCSNDTFTIDGSSVSVVVCLVESARHTTGAKAEPDHMSETDAAKGEAPLRRELPLEAEPGDEFTRTIDDVPLQKVGIARTLHLTLAVGASSVRLEHALLLPGAIALK